MLYVETFYDGQSPIISLLFRKPHFILEYRITTLALHLKFLLLDLNMLLIYENYKGLLKISHHPINFIKLVVTFADRINLVAYRSILNEHSLGKQ